MRKCYVLKVTFNQLIVTSKLQGHNWIKELTLALNMAPSKVNLSLALGKQTGIANVMIGKKAAPPVIDIAIRNIWRSVIFYNTKTSSYRSDSFRVNISGYACMYIASVRNYEVIIL